MSALRTVDRRQTPLADGCRSLVEWVTGRLDVTPDTAKIIVATARRVETLPAIESATRSGDLTFDRLVAVARLAEHAGEDTVLAQSAGLDVAGIHRQVALRRRMSRNQEHQGFRDRYVTTQANLDHTALDFHGHLVGIASRVFEEALHTVGDQLPDTPGMTHSRSTRNADALCKMSQDALDGTGADGVESAHGVTVFVDAVDAAEARGHEPGEERVAGVRRRRPIKRRLHTRSPPVLGGAVTRR